MFSWCCSCGMLLKRMGLWSCLMHVWTFWSRSCGHDCTFCLRSLILIDSKVIMIFLWCYDNILYNRVGRWSCMNFRTGDVVAVHHLKLDWLKLGVPRNYWQLCMLQHTVMSGAIGSAKTTATAFSCSLTQMGYSWHAYPCCLYKDTWVLKTGSERLSAHVG